MKILIVLTSHDQLGNAGEKTGFWLEEFAALFHVLTGQNPASSGPCAEALLRTLPS